MGRKVVIVGGVAGGASAAARLRRLDEHAQIVLFERGEYISFANCALPYYIGGEITDKRALTLQTPRSFKARFNVDARVLHEVTAIHPQKRTVTVKDLQSGETLEEGYDELILSTGAEPVKPPIPGMDSERVFTLRTIPDACRIRAFIEQRKPRSALVVGGGYIGVEMAENLCAAGLQVTIVEMAEQLIAPLDYDMACDLHRHVESKGVTLKLGCGVRGVAEAGEGLQIATDGGDISCELLIMAVGVRPETGLAAAAGLRLGERGHIAVSEQMLTSDPHIYAVGDAVEVREFVTGVSAAIPLAGPANKQGRIAADAICGLDSVYTGTQGSAVIKVFDMTAAVTGINEKTARCMGVAYEKSFTFSPSHAGYYPGASNMSIKLLCETPSGRVLGAQVVGYDGVDKRCDVIASAMRFGATAADLAKLELCYAPPYASAKDPVNIAGFAMENVLALRVKNFHWHDVKTLPRDGSVTLLDVRTPDEYERGHIEGFCHIPLDELRERLNELDAGKKAYVACQVGLRGYVATRILVQNGFDAYNLSGGFRLYSAIFGEETGCGAACAP